MNNKEITNHLNIEMETELQEVLSGKSRRYSSPFLCAADINRVLTSLGAVDLDRFDCNGWEWDFWTYYSFENKVFCLSGSGYNGGITFEQSEDEEIEE